MARPFLCVLLCAWAATARADRVHLKSGAVIEGEARRDGDRVVIAVESGQMALAADEVAKIEPGTSPLQRANERRAALADEDVSARMALADYCRDHELRALERELLLEVIERAPDHAAARARLDYVRNEGTWVKRDELLRAQGMVQYEGRWMTREQALELEKLHAETAAAMLARDKARAELEAKKLELAAAAERAEAQQVEAAQPEPVQPNVVYAYPYFSAFGWGWPHPHGHAHRRDRDDCAHGRCRPPRGPRRGETHTPFPIPGVKDPFDYLRGK